MQISVIGTGRMGTGLMKVMAPNLSQVIWGSRDKAKVQELITSAGYETVRAATHSEAMEADVIFVALWFQDLIPWLEENRAALRGKILVEITNPFNETFDDFTLDYGVSAAEEIQKRVPETRVVSAFKNTYFQVFDEPMRNGITCDNLVTSDDQAAKEIVIELLAPLPFRVFDAGGLKNNRTIERMTLLEREIAIRYETYPYCGLRLFP